MDQNNITTLTQAKNLAKMPIQSDHFNTNLPNRTESLKYKNVQGVPVQHRPAPLAGQNRVGKNLTRRSTAPIYYDDVLRSKNHGHGNYPSNNYKRRSYYDKLANHVNVNLSHLLAGVSKNSKNELTSMSSPTSTSLPISSLISTINNNLSTTISFKSSNNEVSSIGGNSSCSDNTECTVDEIITVDTAVQEMSELLKKSALESKKLLDRSREVTPTPKTFRAPVAIPIAVVPPNRHIHVNVSKMARNVTSQLIGHSCSTSATNSQTNSTASFTTPRPYSKPSISENSSLILPPATPPKFNNRIKVSSLKRKDRSRQSSCKGSDLDSESTDEAFSTSVISTVGTLPNSDTTSKPPPSNASNRPLLRKHSSESTPRNVNYMNRHSYMLATISHTNEQDKKDLSDLVVKSRLRLWVLEGLFFF